MSVSKHLRLLFFVSDLDYFISHRLSLALGAIHKGYDVWVMCPYVDSLRELPEGIRVFFLKNFRKSRLSPWSVWKEFLEISKALKSLAPDILHNVGMKPIFLGSYGARSSCGVVNDFSGLGYTFTASLKGYALKKYVLQCIFYSFLPIVLRKKNCVLLCQNKQDESILRKSTKNLNVPISLIPGSGIDMSHFSILPMQKGPPWRLLFAGRLLKEKGLEELVEACRLLNNSDLEILVCGEVDLENPSSCTSKHIEAWKNLGNIQWLGFQKDLRWVYEKVHGAVLPSYREGLPRSLLEACAWGRPIITTQVPGCQDVVIDGVTGYLVQARDALALSIAIDAWIKDDQKEQKGKAGHDHVLKHFSKEKIHPKIFDVYCKILKKECQS
ncbi:N,N'-diacetylbacillosaminyl-diphospho-undecaprenol alpha-1,3-N-acetylgalactosaminyltransferase [Holospora obtusa F1]|uniref:N, N'-diacetylbacillosaminyl-diphospho-undecaprenol alpha-1,3-N-acetylgalactosaminyltransferase n=1 Tax=Holospora obtusa F1 TaxID=1399147 RepID=W6TEA9_HOLOB|nr:glycosyltransferase family 4 protein [Holospora obtusa]ETZ07503.1 N,N'-diacetylbacillosaminyl-diphospho-undecaprenol alpha-1,3-N-acetylgalactosaminyltransferase [Holospora obtusa F1]